MAGQAGWLQMDELSQTSEASSWPLINLELSNTAIHLSRHHDIWPRTHTPCGQVMASVIRIQQSVDRKRHMVPKYSTMLE
jgi:hypothetical protein